MLSRSERRRLRNLKKNDFIIRFFIESYRKGILDFCGSDVKVKFDRNSPDLRTCFFKYNDGEYTKDELYDGIPTKHPNLLRMYIIGKKSWGLWLNEWASGIAEWLFTLDEILEQFGEIKIPESLLIDFKNRIHKKRYKL